LDRENLTLQFAGANQNSLIVRNRQTIDLKGDKYPVGGAHYDPNRTYNCQTVLLEPEDIMYSFSDGFRDQFGGPKNKKFLRANFHEMLLENSRKSMEIQKEVILSVFNNWRGECEQIDDVSIVGLKV
jgi:serine phosphatase RsbU (regulator of sigma subunit)